MIADISSTGARVVSSTMPEPKQELPSEVTPQDVLKAARDAKAAYGWTWAESLGWAHQCRADWAAERDARIQKAQADFFRLQKHRKNVGRLVQAVEVVGYRSGVIRASLNRAEKKAENERLLAKGLEPKHLLL